MIADRLGKLYGTTAYGGHGGGTVFKIAPDGTETVVLSFSHAVGRASLSGLIMDRAGNLYGTASEGGAGSCIRGCGTVFKIPPKGKATVLYSFQGGNDGAFPVGNLLLDRAGNLYGTTYEGGGTDSPGTVFKLSPGGGETILYTFTGGNVGAGPMAGLTADEAGNLYGTTTRGGSTDCAEGRGCGTVFKLAPDGTVTGLHSFIGGRGGALSLARLVADQSGNLYGTTLGGGNKKCTENYFYCGTVFKLRP